MLYSAKINAEEDVVVEEEEADGGGGDGDKDDTKDFFKILNLPKLIKLLLEVVLLVKFCELLEAIAELDPFFFKNKNFKIIKNTS